MKIIIECMYRVIFDKTAPPAVVFIWSTASRCAIWKFAWELFGLLDTVRMRMNAHVSYIVMQRYPWIVPSYVTVEMLSG